MHNNVNYLPNINTSGFTLFLDKVFGNVNKASPPIQAYEGSKTTCSFGKSRATSSLTLRGYDAIIFYLAISILATLHILILKCYRMVGAYSQLLPACLQVQMLICPHCLSQPQTQHWTSPSRIILTQSWPKVWGSSAQYSAQSCRWRSSSRIQR